MAKWLHTVNFKSFWEKNIPISEMSQLASAELKKLKDIFITDNDLNKIIEGFNKLCEDINNPTVELYLSDEIKAFDAVMVKLYDWADINRVWISTYF